MNRWISEGILAVAVALPVLTGVAWAGGNEDLKCSNATLKGLYMFANSGYESVNPNLVPLGVTGRDVFYGNGKFDSLATISIGGTIIRDDAAPGTYNVNSDCTGTAIVHMTPPTPDVHLELFVAPDGDQIFEIETDPGTVLSGPSQRVAR